MKYSLFWGTIPILFLSVIVCADSPRLLFEAPEQVISSTRYPISIDHAPDKVQIITKRQINADGITDFEHLFDSAANVSIINAGGQRSLFLRGGASHLTVVSVDGIPLRDASSPAATPILNHLPVSTIDRIEIISGNKGTLYGAYAANGVVAITTDLQRTGNFTNMSADFGDRSYQGQWTRGLHWGDTQLNLTGSFSNRASRSDFSETSEIDVKNANQISALIRQNWGSVTVSAQTFLATGQDDLDYYVFFPAAKIDDPNRLIRFSEYRTRISGEWRVRTDLTGSVAYSHLYSVRNDRNDPDSVSTVNERYINVGGTDHLEGTLFWEGMPGAHLLGGVSWDRDATSIEHYVFSDSIYPVSSTDVSQSRGSLFGTWRQQVGGFEYGGDVRYDVASDYRVLTYALNTQILIPYEVVLSGTYRTGFNAPSLYQRYSEFGKADLNAELSKSWELGLSKRLMGVQLSARYFDTTIDQLISYDFVSNTYSNLPGTNRYLGLELDAKIDELMGLRETFVSYAHHDSSTGTSRSYLIPEYRWAIGSGIGTSSWSVRGNWIWVGPRFDNTTGPILTLPSYSTFNLSGMHRLSATDFVVVSLENALNTQYEWVTNYSGMGRTLKVGYYLEM